MMSIQLKKNNISPAFVCLYFYIYSDIYMKRNTHTHICATNVKSNTTPSGAQRKKSKNPKKKNKVYKRLFLKLKLEFYFFVYVTCVALHTKYCSSLLSLLS